MREISPHRNSIPLAGRLHEITWPRQRMKPIQDKIMAADISSTAAYRWRSHLTNAYEAATVSAVAGFVDQLVFDL